MFRFHQVFGMLFPAMEKCSMANFIGAVTFIDGLSDHEKHHCAKYIAKMLHVCIESPDFAYCSKRMCIFHMLQFITSGEPEHNAQILFQNLDRALLMRLLLDKRHPRPVFFTRSGMLVLRRFISYGALRPEAIEFDLVRVLMDAISSDSEEKRQSIMLRILGHLLLRQGNLRWGLQLEEEMVDTKSILFLTVSITKKINFCAQLISNHS